MGKAKFVIFKDFSDYYRFKLVDENGSQLLTGKEYGTKEECIHAVERVKKYVPFSEITGDYIE